MGGCGDETGPNEFFKWRTGLGEFWWVLFFLRFSDTYFCFNVYTGCKLPKTWRGGGYDGVVTKTTRVASRLELEPRYFLLFFFSIFFYLTNNCSIFYRYIIFDDHSSTTTMRALVRQGGTGKKGPTTRVTTVYTAYYRPREVYIFSYYYLLTMCIRLSIRIMRNAQAAVPNYRNGQQHHQDQKKKGLNAGINCRCRLGSK
jgi:hypothetical protein